LDAQSESWLAGLADRSQALLFDGPPGIGKTHAFSEIVDRARDLGVCVLRAQPAQAEIQLIGSALIDLCSDIDEARISRLPGVQAAALSAALLRAAPGATALPQVVARGFSTLLRELAADGLVLVCLDDIQWLDAQTRDAVAFAARRLPDAGVGIIATLRTSPGQDPPDLVAGLAAALPLTRRTIAPLDATRAARMLRAELGRETPAQVIRAAVRNSGGNPLFALEIARSLLARPTEQAGLVDESVPVPDALFELVGRHIDQLPERSRAALAAAAALRKPTLRQLRDLGWADDLDAAEHAGLVTVEGREISFNHPMYAAAAYRRLGASARVQLHARLAEVAEGAEERARHLAHGSVDPDETVAAALDDARSRALARGALEAALEAARLAVGATPPGSRELVPRRIELAGLLFRAGDGEPAREEVARAVAEAEDPVLRARALYALALLVNDTVEPYQAVPFYLEALELAEPDAQLAADIHMGLAICFVDDWQRALEHGQTAVALVESVPDADPARVAKALAAEVGARFYTGGGADLEACRRAVELQAGDLSLPVADRAIAVLFYLQYWVDDFPGARASMDTAYRLALDEGDEGSRCYVLGTRAKLEVRAGRWAEADRLIDECLALAEMGGNSVYMASMGLERAWLAAYRGNLDPAIELAERDIARGAAGSPLIEQRGYGIRGWCALARGDAQAAATDLDRYIAGFETNNAGEPALRQLAGDHIEALVAAGRLDDAERALAALLVPATRLDRTALLAAAARAEALLRAEQGDLDAAIGAATRALQYYDQIERPLERARTLLAQGQIHRRFRQRALARDELAAAKDAFGALGARGFAARAGIELARIGSRVPASGELSETERRIAEHAARGMRSAEIGRTLFLSTKTVSANLTRIYQKLGVRNRAELAAHLGAQPGIGSRN
jgi:DNA-binding CsgD family transcriptional regulator/DNA polymerase III delta prime subunit